jgi:outer membrane lipoprotein-sorting protein
MTMKHLAYIAFAFLLAGIPALCGCGSGVGKVSEIPPTDLLTAQEVMARTVAIYEQCATYRDRGVMTRTFAAEQGSDQVEQSFTTVFERPYRFRFECREDDNRYIIYANAAVVRAWWGAEGGIQPMGSLDEAIGRAVGPSNGASHTIPRLLMPERVRGRSLAELQGLDRLPDAMLDETACYRIVGSDRTGAPYVIWIERQTFMVRRIDETHAFEDFTTTDSTLYYPELDPDLADAEFYLKTPAAESARKELTAKVF